ncbi:MAG TPA: hypothetical protein VMN37_03720 [Gemmatimonadales bacterium]|nr:hypothetical protein [Gemmatimonadales bacterium]
MGPDERLALRHMETHPEGAARLLERAPPADAATFLAQVPARTAAAVVRAMVPAAAAACAGGLADEVFAEIMAELPLDAAASILHRLDPARRETVLARLPVTAEAPLRRLLSYGPHTAGALADPLVLALPEDLTVAEAQRQLRGTGEHLFYYFYIVARDQTLVGVLDLPELMAARPKDTLGAAMHRNPVRLEAHTDFATLVAHPAWQDLDALPVVDPYGKLVGAIRHKSIRRLEAELGLRARNESVLATLVGLSELYWAGLAGMFPRVAASVLPENSTPPPAEPSEEAPDAR